MSEAVLRLALPQRERTRLGPREAEELLFEAARLGVWPAVSRNIQAGDPGRLRENAARNLWLKREQQSLIRSLAAAGIRAYAVKGVDLAERLYPDLSWRSIQDIDLVVEPADAGRGFEALRSLGLEPIEPWEPVGLARQLGRCRALAPQLKFTAPGGLLVELHWDWPGPLPEGDLLDQPERYLVYLCAHAGKHFWRHLKWTGDIALLLEQYGGGLDWPMFWRAAEEHGAGRSCAISLELCRRWYGLASPGLDARLDRRTRSLSDRAAREILDPAAPRSSPVWNQLSLARWRDRVSMLRAWLSPQPQEWSLAEARGWPAWRVWAERVLHLSTHWTRRPIGRLARARGWPAWRVWAERVVHVSRHWTCRPIGRLAQARGWPAWRVWAERVLHLSTHWTRRPIGRLTPAEWAILAEACVVVAAMEIARRTAPARRLVRPATAAAQGPQWRMERLQRMSWLVDVAANRQPVEIRCLTRSLALAWMLHRRGQQVDLRIGMRQLAGRVHAHAWLESRGRVVQQNWTRKEMFPWICPIDTNPIPK